MKNREEIINRIEDAWVLQELLYELEAFHDDELFDKTLEVINAFSDIIYEIVGIDKEEQEEIDDRVYRKTQAIKYIIKKNPV